MTVTKVVNQVRVSSPGPQGSPPVGVFMADGTVPMTGDFDAGGHDLLGVGELELSCDEDNSTTFTAEPSGAVRVDVNNLTKFFFGSDPRTGVEIPDQVSLAFVDPGVAVLSEIKWDEEHGQFIFRDGNSAWPPPLVGVAVGSIGVGTDEPTVPLQVGSNFFVNDTNTFGDGQENDPYVVVGPYDAAVGGDQGASLNITNNNSSGLAIMRFGIVGGATGAMGEFGASGSTGVVFPNTVFFNTKGAYPLLWAINNSEVMRVSPDGYMGIGTSDPQTELDVNGTATLGGLIMGDGAYISDGDDNPSIDPHNRLLYAPDGSTVQLDYSTAGAISMGGAGTPLDYSNLIGQNAGYGATGAIGSNFLGPEAGYGATDACNSNFIGSSAGYGATGAYYSNFIGGDSTGYGATGASHSNFLGQFTGYQATGTNDSNFLGYQAGYQAAGSQFSNFMGLYAGYQAAGAYNSNFLGYSAGNGATGASYSNFIGDAAGAGADNAQSSNFIGVQAGNGASGVYSSNFIGQMAGYGQTSASRSIFMGSYAGFPSAGDGTDFENNLIIDQSSISGDWARPTAADIRLNALLYGTFADTYADQQLTVNGQLVLGGAFDGAPTAFNEGAIYYDQTEHAPYFYNGTEWTAFGGGIDLGTSSAILMGDGAGGITDATAGTDYIGPLSNTSSTVIQKGDGSGGLTDAEAGNDYVGPLNNPGSGLIQKDDGYGGLTDATAGTDYAGPLDSGTAWGVPYVGNGWMYLADASEIEEGMVLQYDAYLGELVFDYPKLHA